MVLDVSQNNIDSIAEGFVFHRSLTHLASWLTLTSISGPSGIRRICRCQPNHLWRWWMYRRNPQLIQTVNLTSNRLPHLHGRTFAGNVRRTLRNLYLAHNLLTRVPRFFSIFQITNHYELQLFVLASIDIWFETLMPKLQGSSCWSGRSCPSWSFSQHDQQGGQVRLY